MGQSILDRIQAKLELFRLEQRYTRRRNRRSTFVSGAVYVDGEYVYQTPNTTGSSADSSNTRINALHGERAVASPSESPASISAPFTTTTVDSPSRGYNRNQSYSHNRNVDNVTTDSAEDTDMPMPMQSRKRLHRFSSVPGFGGSFSSNFGSKDTARMQRRTSMIR